MSRWHELLKRIGDNKRGAEIGVWEGDNAYNLLEENPTLFLYCIDQWVAGDDCYIKSKDGKSKLSQDAFDEAKAKTCNRLKKYHGRCTIIPTSSNKASELFEDGSLDFVFIDANHSYETVKEDIFLWLPKVKEGGFISGHDYGVYPGVRKAVDELFDIVELGSDFTWFVKI